MLKEYESDHGTGMNGEAIAQEIFDYPALRNLLYDILFCGRSIPYNPGTELVSIGTMFGFLKDNQGRAVICILNCDLMFHTQIPDYNAVHNQP